MNYLKIAREWREQNPRFADRGIVLIWSGAVYGWKNSIRNADHEQPGVVAVDAQGRVYEAQGGDEQNGSKGWVVKND